MMNVHLPALLSPRAKLAPQAFLIRELADEAANPCARAAEADSVCFQSMFGSVRITQIRSGLRGRSDEVDYSRAPLQDFSWARSDIVPSNGGSGFRLPLAGFLMRWVSPFAGSRVVHAFETRPSQDGASRIERSNVDDAFSGLRAPWHPIRQKRPVDVPAGTPRCSEETMLAACRARVCIGRFRQDGLLNHSGIEFLGEYRSGEARFWSVCRALSGRSGGAEREHPLDVPGHGHQAPLAAHLVEAA